MIRYIDFTKVSKKLTISIIYTPFGLDDFRLCELPIAWNIGLSVNQESSILRKEVHSVLLYGRKNMVFKNRRHASAVFDYRFLCGIRIFQS